MSEDKLLIYGLGGLMMGLWVGSIVYGINCWIFVYWWSYCYTEEPRGSRILVCTMMALNTVMTGYLIAWAFDFLVLDFGEPDQFPAAWGSWNIILDMCCRVPVSSFFAEEAWRMTGRNMLFATVVGLLIAGSAACAIAAKVTAYFLNAQISGLNLNLIIAWVGILLVTSDIMLTSLKIALELVGDVVITITLSITLFRSRIDYKATNSLVNRLLLMVAETQLPPAIMVVVLLAMILNADLFQLITFFGCTPSVYVMCFLLVVTQRYRFRAETSTVSGERWRDNTFQLKSRTTRNEPIAVTVDTETVVHAAPSAEQSAANLGESGVSRMPAIYDSKNRSMHVRLE